MFLLATSILFVLGVAICGETNAARILMIVPEEVKSHFALADILLRKLAIRDHEVTMISSLEPKMLVKNYRHVQLTGINEGMLKMMANPNNKKINFLQFRHVPLWKFIFCVELGGTTTTEIALTQPSVQNILNDPDEHFDLIVILMFHTEALYGLAHRFDAPVVVIGSTVSGVWTNHLVANPAPSSYVPNFVVGYSGGMTILQRIYNTVHNLALEYYRRYVYFPKLDVAMHKFFPDAPPLLDVIYNRTAVVLLNSHPTTSEVVPHVPAMVEVGGFHIEDPEALPQDVQNFMDNAQHGVIFFSMGSNVKSTDFENTTKYQILKVFSRLQLNVIWKFEEENLPGKPDNVLIMKWCPQTDIMAHPNLKLFITHGGLLSITEAVYYGVPIIGMPVFGDQHTNIATITHKGYGVRLSFDELTEESLFSTIQEVITNPKYRKAVQVASQILRGQPVRPLDTAIFWIEHVIRHRGAQHLRTAALDLDWFQIYSLDIICIFLLILLFVCYTIKYFIKYPGEYFKNIHKKYV